jgi:glycosyltransferase involved in cell wall biosynthesis
MIDDHKPPRPTPANRPIVRYKRTPLPLRQTPAPPVSVIVLTRNESTNIRDCLASAAWCDDVHVLDSFSSDGTPDIAAAAGAHVHYHPFTTIDAQHNWAIDNIPTKHPWQFHIDADERFTPELVAEMYRRLGPQGSDLDAAGFRIPSQMIFQNRWVRHGSGYPNYQVRLIHRGRCRFILVGHGQREHTVGRIGTFDQPYAHYSFSRGMGHWFRRHNIYSDFEAAEAIADLAHPLAPLNLVSGDRVIRRRELKRIAYRLRGRGIWRFLFNYFYQGGWLDGSPGFHYSVINLVYEYWTELKIIEGGFRRRGQQNVLANHFAGPTIAQRIKTEILHADEAAQRRADRKLTFLESVRDNPLRDRLRYWKYFLRDDIGPEIPCRPLLVAAAAMFGGPGLERGARGLHSAFFKGCVEYMTGLFYREHMERRRAMAVPSPVTPTREQREPSMSLA